MAAQPKFANLEQEDEPVLVREGVTTEEYLAMPETVQPYNLIEGRLYMSPTPIMRHQDIVLQLAVKMHAFEATAGGKAIVSPMDCHFPDGSVLQPDVAYISPERLSIIDRWVMGAPDLVIEVLSPGTRRFDRNRKLAVYERNGVPEAWLVDPSSFTGIVFSGENNAWVRERSVLFGDDIPSDLVNVGSAGLEEFV